MTPTTNVDGLAWDSLAIERLVETADMVYVVLADLAGCEEEYAAMHQLHEAKESVRLALPALESSLKDPSRGPLKCDDPRGYCFEEEKTEHISGCPAALARRVAAFVAASRHKDMTDDIVDRSALLPAWLDPNDLAREIATLLALDEDKARDVAVWAQTRIAFELASQRQKIEAILEDLMKKPTNISRNTALSTVAVVLAAFKLSETRSLAGSRHREARMHTISHRLRAIASAIEALDLSVTAWPALDCKHHYTHEYLLTCIADSIDDAAADERARHDV